MPEKQTQTAPNTDETLSKPSQAEGDEATVDESIRQHEQKGDLSTPPKR